MSVKKITKLTRDENALTTKRVENKQYFTTRISYGRVDVCVVVWRHERSSVSLHLYHTHRVVGKVVPNLYYFTPPMEILQILRPSR